MVRTSAKSQITVNQVKKQLQLTVPWYQFMQKCIKRLKQLSECGSQNQSQLPFQAISTHVQSRTKISL